MLPGTSAHKRARLLQFAQDKRTSFIKLLVLSQWAYRAADVSKLIDLRSFLYLRDQAYADVVALAGELKRDLVRAQTGSPDLRTAVRLLALDPTALARPTGLLAPPPLTARQTLRTLRQVNTILKKRLVLHEQAALPRPWARFLVRDGRVTFRLPHMFELALSVAADDPASQFFFVDLRFLFTPAAVARDHKVVRRLEALVNDDLRRGGLRACFDNLNNRVLSIKIAALHQQALLLAQYAYARQLFVLLTHRTLVVQYWLERPGPKSWIQIGVARRSPASSDR
ncbi:mediator complex subunit [Ascosphaera acerosa]|nr:mediator complex subunit [Ascosphaera acerosa]